MDAPAAVSIGGVVAGRYRVDGVLGEGGMGAVYDVVDLDTGTPFALKVVLDANPDHVKRFEREGKATMRIVSDHVVRVLDVGTIDGKVPFMVMERLEGDTLKALVESVALDERTVADLMMQACEGLAHAHALGIVHRDVKPSNLFVLDRTRPLTLKVLDFGISRMTTYEAFENRGATMTVTDSAALLGSPQYTSPEQLQSPSGVDERADIWSLGVSMYFALTRRLPFAGNSLAEVLVAVMSKPIPTLGPRASPAMAAIVSKCLTRALDERYRRVSDLAAALAPLASPQLAALLPSIQKIANGAQPIVAPVSSAKQNEPGEHTQTFNTGADEKATVVDLRAQRPLSMPPALSVEPVTAVPVMLAPPRRSSALPLVGLAFALGLCATIVAGAFVFKSFRNEPTPVAIPVLSVSTPPAIAAAPAPEPEPEPQPEPASTDPKLELVADAPIAKVIRPTYRRFAIEDGKALVTVAPFKNELPIEVELSNGARAKGSAKPGGATTIKLTTTKAPRGAPRPAPKPSSDSELHKSPYQ